MAKEINTDPETDKSAEKEQISYKPSDGEMSYLDFFGFSQNPFPVVPDDKNFYVSKSIDLTISEIIYGIKERKGFMVLTGEVGLGKTTITRRILHVLEENKIETSLVFHTAYSDVELLKEINRDFGLIKKTKPVSDKLGDQMELLNTFLVAKNRSGKNCVIIIDDAQNLDSRSLELVRMISNLETDMQKLVQIVLVGQSELDDKLNSKELRQLKSRVIINKKVVPLKPKDMQDYLQFKLNVCGSYGQVTITKNALKYIYGYSKGNFRLINVLMDRCLCVAFLDSSTEITRNIVKRAGKDLGVNRTIYDLKKTGLVLGIIVALLLVVGLIISFPERKNINPVKSSQPEKISVTKKQLPLSSPKIPESISGFLKSYKLTEYSEIFYAAVKNLDFAEISEKVLAEKGYQLIELEKITEKIRKKYGVLSCKSTDNSKNKFVLFWKPEFQINRFYYSYKGKDILMLQQALKNAGFYYDYAIDGTVGKNLMKAVIKFQKYSGLETTGYPDKVFVFLLANQKRKGLPPPPPPVVINVPPEPKPENITIEPIDTDNAVQINQELITQ
jgi:general secretion pathway protein A